MSWWRLKGGALIGRRALNRGGTFLKNTFFFKRTVNLVAKLLNKKRKQDKNDDIIHFNVKSV